MLTLYILLRNVLKVRLCLTVSRTLFFALRPYMWEFLLCSRREAVRPVHLVT